MPIGLETATSAHMRGQARSTYKPSWTPMASFAFGYLHTDKLPARTVTILHNDVRSQSEEWGLEVGPPSPTGRFYARLTRSSLEGLSPPV